MIFRIMSKIGKKNLIKFNYLFVYYALGVPSASPFVYANSRIDVILESFILVFFRFVPLSFLEYKKNNKKNTHVEEKAIRFPSVSRRRLSFLRRRSSRAERRKEKKT